MKVSYKLALNALISICPLFALRPDQSAAPSSEHSRSALESKIGVPISSQETVGLVEALRIAALYLPHSYVSYGIELKGGAPPAVVLSLKEGLTLKQVLDSIFSQTKEYEYTVVSDHLIDVSPKSARSRSDDPMSLPIQTFDVERMGVGEIFTAPELFVRELQTQESRRKIYTFAGPFGGPEVTLHLRNKTLREVFNAIAIATEHSAEGSIPVGWIFDPDREATGDHRLSAMFVTSNIPRPRTSTQAN